MQATTRLTNLQIISALACSSIYLSSHNSKCEGGEECQLVGQKGREHVQTWNISTFMFSCVINLYIWMPKNPDICLKKWHGLNC